MLCLYLLGQKCLHLTFKPYLSSETYSRKYEKVPNIVFHAHKYITEKHKFVKNVWPASRLCLFTFRPIASKQLNSLLTIVALSWLGGAEVTLQLWVQEVRQGFLCLIFCVLLLLCVTFLSQNTLFVTTFCNFFCNINLYSILNILQDLWPIIRVQRYRPSIFK